MRKSWSKIAVGVYISFALPVNCVSNVTSFLQIRLPPYDESRDRLEEQTSTVTFRRLTANSNACKLVSEAIVKRGIKSWFTLPRLAIAQHLTRGTLDKYALEHRTLECYALRHNIPLHVESFELCSNIDQRRAKLYTIQRILPFYQWVIFLDGDTMVANYTKSFESFLDDSQDIILQDRDNGEVGSYFFSVRNSRRGHAFLTEWMSLADRGVGGLRDLISRDNGDLMELIPWLLTCDLSQLSQRRTLSQYIDTMPQYLPFYNFARLNTTKAIKYFRECMNVRVVSYGDSTFSKYSLPSPTTFVGCTRYIVQKFRKLSAIHGVKFLYYAQGVIRNVEMIGLYLHKPKLKQTILRYSDFIYHGKLLSSLMALDDLLCHPTYIGVVDSNLSYSMYWNEEKNLLLEKGYFRN